MELHSEMLGPTQPRNQSVSITNDVNHSIIKALRKKSTTFERSHRDYLAFLQVPSPEAFELIKAAQERQEQEMKKKRSWSVVSNQRQLNQRSPGVSNHQRETLSNYDIFMEPSTCWMDIVRQVRYQNYTQVLARDEFGALTARKEFGVIHNNYDRNKDAERSARARYRWKKAILITQRACMDQGYSSEEFKDNLKSALISSEVERGQEKEKHLERRKTAKVIDLRYFLELIDVRHRYGANLRTYHEEWRKSDTRENFFFWLDYGEGRYVNCKACPRERVEREQIRYLSREERRNYRVIIDKNGRLCWAKNGNRIDTTEKFKDSIHGIVPIADPTPSSRNPVSNIPLRSPKRIDDVPFASASCSLTTHSRVDVSDFCTAAFTKPELEGARCIKNIRHVSTATILDRLLRSSVKKNTWIFVTDTHFRMYMGIKQSGNFQHSSFLYGSRLSAAGGIKVEDGKLKELSPLSGHYRTPLSNFRSFVKDLVEAGADTSQVSISSSYTVLVGLETYYRAHRMTKHYLGMMKQTSCSYFTKNDKRKKDNLEEKQHLQIC